MTEPRRVYRLALRDFHTAAGATFRERGEWSLPEHYGNPSVGYAALRSAAAVFDRSQRSRFIVSGTDAETVLSAVFTGHVDELEEGRSMRSAALGERGIIRDLVLISRTGGIAYFVTGEPGQRQETLARLEAAVGADFDVRIDDRTETTVAIGLAGPDAALVAERHLSDALPARLQPLHGVTFEFHGFRTLAVRTSDTGEDGFEFIVSPAVGQHMLETLVAAGVPLAGSIALEAARVESCIPAFEPDLSPGLTPAEADIDLLLGISGGQPGRSLAALLVEGPPYAPGEPVLEKGAPVGEVRSCVHSYSLDATVALAVVPSRVALPGSILGVHGHTATVVARPFYRRRRS